MYVCMYIHMYVCECIHIYIYIYIYIYMCIDTRINSQILVFAIKPNELINKLTFWETVFAMLGPNFGFPDVSSWLYTQLLK